MADETRTRGTMYESTLATGDEPLQAVRHLTLIDVKDKIPVFSDRLSPGAGHAPHISKQRVERILIDKNSLLFQAIREAGYIKSCVVLNVLENLIAILKPHGGVVAVVVLVAGRANSRSKIVKQDDQVLRLNKAERMSIPDFLDWPKALAHGKVPVLSQACSVQQVLRNCRGRIAVDVQPDSKFTGGEHGRLLSKRTGVASLVWRGACEPLHRFSSHHSYGPGILCH
jgi:hypothetical protein